MMKSIPSDNMSSTAEEMVYGDGAEEESRAGEVEVAETDFNDTSSGNIRPHSNLTNVGTNISDVAQGAVPVMVHPSPDAEAAELQEPPPQQQQQHRLHPDSSANADADDDEEEGERSTANKVTWRPFSSVSNGLSNVGRRFKEATSGRRQLAHRPPITSPNTFGNWDSSGSSSEQSPPPSLHDDDKSQCSEPEKYARLMRSIPTHLVTAFMTGDLEYTGGGVGWEYKGRYANTEGEFVTDNGNNTERFSYSSSDNADATSIEFLGTFNYYRSTFDDKFVMNLTPLEDPGQCAISGSGKYSYTFINEEGVKEVETTNYAFTGEKLDGVVKLERFERVFVSPVVSPTPVDTDQDVSFGNIAFDSSGAASGTKRAASRNLSARARSPFERLRTPLQEMATRVGSTRQELIDLLGSPLQTLADRLGSPLQRFRKKSRVEEEAGSADDEEEDDEAKEEDDDDRSGHASRPLSPVEAAILKSVHPAMEEMQKIAKAKIMKYGSKSGMTSKLSPPDTYTSSLDKVKIVFIWSFPVDGLARMLELSKMRVLTLLNPSLDQLFQNLIRELKDNYGYTETQAANLVYDHTLWIDAFPVVADWDWRSKNSFKEFSKEAADISLEMIVGLLDKLEKLEAIYAVGAEGFKMLERIRDNHPKYAKLITQQELTHHGMQLANGYCTGPQIVRYLVQVVFPACSILAGRQVREVVRASDMEQLLRFVSHVADRSKLSQKELGGVGGSIKAAFDNNHSVEDAVAAIKDLPEVSELAAVITGMTFGSSKNRSIRPVVTHYRNRKGNQENPNADQMNCKIEWRNGANEDNKALKDIVRYILKHGQNHGIFKDQHWWEIEANILTIFDIDLKFKYLLQKAIKEESSIEDIVAAIRNMPEVSKLTAVITGMSFVGMYATANFRLCVERYLKRSENLDNPSSRKIGCNIEWRQSADNENEGEVRQAMRDILDVWIKHPQFRDMGWSDILRNLNGVFVGL